MNSARETRLLENRNEFVVYDRITYVINEYSPPHPDVFKCLKPVEKIAFFFFLTNDSENYKITVSSLEHPTKKKN